MSEASTAADAPPEDPFTEQVCTDIARAAFALEPVIAFLKSTYGEDDAYTLTMRAAAATLDEMFSGNTAHAEAEAIAAAARAS